MDFNEYVTKQKMIEANASIFKLMKFSLLVWGKNSYKAIIKFFTIKRWEVLHIDYGRAEVEVTSAWGWGKTRSGCIRYNLITQINQFGDRRIIEDY